MRGVLDIPDDLRDLQGLITRGLERVERVFNDQLISDLPPVDAMCAHIDRYRGKMLRPTLTLLSGVAARGDSDLDDDTALGEAPVVCACVCELVHMATLVHDDVLDEAEIRRRGQTINSIKGNETSVILGDYLIASAYELCSSLDSPVPSRIVGEASAIMCTGELLQLHNRGNLSLDEDTYFEILRRKTAALIGASCELGALCAVGFAKRGDPIAGALKRYGAMLGIAFQIQDDLLDLTGTTDGVGKSVGKDLEKGKLTYPLIHHLAHSGDRGRTLEIIEDAAAMTPADGRELLERIGSTGSLDAARRSAEGYVGEALASLEGVPRGPGRPMLELMARAVVDRTH